MALLTELKTIGILTTATIRADRTRHCPFDEKVRNRGAIDYRVDANSGIRIIKWVDNNIVHLASTYASVNPVTQVQRWEKVKKVHINVPRPAIVKSYNASMGGIDLSDMLLSLYRTKINTKRWYIKMFFDCVDIAKINGWLMYRRYCEQVGISKCNIKPLLEFTRELSEGLMNAGKIKPILGRPKKSSKSPASIRISNTCGCVYAVPTPVRDTRYDMIGHWPEFLEMKGRCRQCNEAGKESTPRSYCMKCNMPLCCTQKRNCFLAFHTK